MDGGKYTDELTGQVGWLGLKVGGYLALSLHLSNEPRELSQWLAMMTAR